MLNDLTEAMKALDGKNIYHSLRRESIKNASSASPIGVQTVRPTWFEDIAVPVVPKETKPQPHHAPQWQEPQPLHGLKLVIKEEVLPMKDQPEFPLAVLAVFFFLSSVQRRMASARSFKMFQSMLHLGLID